MAPFVTPPNFDPKVDSNYHYIPTGWTCLLFISLFGISTSVHLVQAIHFRLWWLLPTAVLAGLGEITGWSGRYWSSLNDGILQTPYAIQICSTIIAPTPLLAAYFIIIGRLIVLHGPQYSRLKPNLYKRIFLTADIVALFVQASGGGMASGSVAQIGADIMLGGIIFQLGALVVFIILSTEFVIRLYLDRPFHRKAGGSFSEDADVDRARDYVHVKGEGSVLTVKTRRFLYGVSFSIVCLFIRGVYRTIELADGFNGRIISTQVYFNVLDGGMVLLAFFALNVFHPGYVLGRNK